MPRPPKSAKSKSAKTVAKKSAAKRAINEIAPNLNTVSARQIEERYGKGKRTSGPVTQIAGRAARDPAATTDAEVASLAGSVLAQTEPPTREEIVEKITGGVLSASSELTKGFDVALIETVRDLDPPGLLDTNAGIDNGPGLSEIGPQSLAEHAAAAGGLGAFESTPFDHDAFKDRLRTTIEKARGEKRDIDDAKFRSDVLAQVSMPVTYTFESADEADHAAEVVATMTAPGAVGRRYKTERVGESGLRVSL